MKKGSKKVAPVVSKPYDYEICLDGKVRPVEGCKNYYSVQDLVIEAKKILNDHGFKLSDLFDTKYGRTYKDLQTYNDKYTNTNLYRYWGDGKSSVSMPNDVLFDMIIYMKKLGDRIKDVKERKSYLDKIDVLENKTIMYCLENGYFKEIVGDIIRKLDKAGLKNFLRALETVKFEESAWRFWLCYSVLNQEGHATVKSLLSVCTCSAFESIRRFCEIYSWERKSSTAFYNSVQAAFEKHGNDIEKLRQKLLALVLDYLRPCGDKREVYRRVWEIVNYGVEVGPEDWSLMFTYSFLRTDRDKFERVEEFILNALEQRKYLHSSCPQELALHFQEQYQEIVDNCDYVDFEQDSSDEDW